MKKNYMNWLGLGLLSTLGFTSCMSEVEAPAANDLAKALNESSEVVIGEENLRKIPAAYNYLEEFDNKIIFVPVDGLIFPQGLYPGTGVGSATRFGKGKTSFSFINQLAQIDENNQLTTIGAPVSDFYGAELIDMGLSGIPSNVSSLTTDGKGNAIWFQNIENITKQVAEDRIEFQATIEVVGGNGKFENAFGEGVAEGYFNPLNGVGKSIVRARINY